jgi:hypothetical protein
MTFALWDLETGNLVGAYDSVEAALAVVRRAIQTHGPAYVDPLALVRENSRGRSKVLAEGAALVEYAQQAAPPDTTSCAPASRPASA